jgi:hypothetical protein
MLSPFTIYDLRFTILRLFAAFDPSRFNFLIRISDFAAFRQDFRILNRLALKMPLGLASSLPSPL